MSDYDVKEESQEESAPYELYKWVGTYRSYYMTSDKQTHRFEERDYIPIAGLKRSSLKCNTHEDSDSSLEITVPISHQLVKDYGFQISPPELTLYVYRFQRDVSAYVLYFKGRITNVNTDGEETVFKIPNVFGTILSGNIPNVYIQPPCNNVLFDELCKVDKDSNSIESTIVSIDSTTIQVASVGVFPDNWMKGGEIAFKFRNERRTIISQIGTTLTISYQFGRAGVGEQVILSAGCDHSFSGANGCPKFANQLNYGGFPFVPGESDNIFLIGV